MDGSLLECRCHIAAILVVAAGLAATPAVRAKDLAQPLGAAAWNEDAVLDSEWTYADYGDVKSSSSDSVIDNSTRASGAARCCERRKCRGACREQAGDWTFRFTQTADFVTNLALPFTLTPEFAAVLQDDFQFQTLGEALYQHQLDDDQSIQVGYNFYQSLHPKVDQLDLMLHNLRAEYRCRLLERTSASVQYSYSYYFLHGSSFVTQNQVGTYLQFQPTDECDIKVGADYLHAAFHITSALTSDNVVPRLELIRYLSDDRNDYLTLGAGYILSNALLAGVSYDAYSAFAGGRWMLGAENKTEFQLLGLYAFYDFDGPDPIQPAVVRRDHIFQMTGRLSYYLNEDFYVFGQYIFFDDESNVIRQDFDSDTISLGAAKTW